MLAMRQFMRSEAIQGAADPRILEDAGLDHETVLDMYRIMALAAYEDRYVIPTGHREETLGLWRKRQLRLQLRQWLRDAFQQHCRFI